MFNETSIKKRLYLAFACMLGIMIFFAFFRGQQLNTVMDRYNQTMNTINIRQQNIGSIGTMLNKLRYDYMALGLLWEHPDFYAQVNLANNIEYKNTLLNYLQISREQIENDQLINETEKELCLSIIDKIEYVLINQYITSSNEIISKLESGEMDSIADALYYNFTIGTHLQSLVWELRDRTFALSQYITETMSYYDGLDERIFNIATLIGITIALLLTVVLAQTIQMPISRLRNAVSEVTAGNLDHPIRMKYSDDIGKLSHDIADMVISISEKQRIEQSLEESQAASEAKSAFIANTSHEIRTPMNSIIGYAELALDDQIPDVTRNYIENVLTNAKWLLNVINEILDFSKIESGNLELEEVPFYFNEVIKQCRLLLATSASNKEIELEFKNETASNQCFLGDPTKLGQIFINLLSNSIKFTHKGSVTLLITTIENNESSSTVYFEVKDTGIGMTSEQIKKALEPFSQADTSTTRKYGGTGIGLTITNKLLEAMGGKLNIESTPDFGSTFSFSLSFNTVEESNFTTFIDDGNATIEKPYFEKGNILLVEDNAMNIGVASTHLKKVGLTCFIAKNGEEAVEIVKDRVENGLDAFDLIFMDIHMPVMDGREAATIINKLDTGAPIIAMTAEVLSLTDKESYKSCGMEGYINKPFTSQELWKFLIKYLDK